LQLGSDAAKYDQSLNHLAYPLLSLGPSNQETGRAMKEEALFSA
jgi:hypothetical protein